MDGDPITDQDLEDIRLPDGTPLTAELAAQTGQRMIDESIERQSHGLHRDAG
jgi:hypothetical protein